MQNFSSQQNFLALKMGKIESMSHITTDRCKGQNKRREVEVVIFNSVLSKYNNVVFTLTNIVLPRSRVPNYDLA